jgi:hypothetical protein
MTDIVERLLQLAERERPYGSLPDTLEEAAAEIARLRAGIGETLLEREDARAEVERLRAGGCARDQSTTQYCAEAAKLAAENERLRAALEWIVETTLAQPGLMVEKARAALEGRT